MQYKSKLYPELLARREQREQERFNNFVNKIVLGLCTLSIVAFYVIEIARAM